MIDLESVDPKGRFDVLVYNFIQHLTNGIESKHGLSGIWDNAKPLVNQVVNEHVSGIEIPSEMKMILGIMQANMKRKNVDNNE